MIYSTKRKTNLSKTTSFSLEKLEKALKIEHQAKEKCLKKSANTIVKVNGLTSAEFSYLCKTDITLRNENNSIILIEQNSDYDSFIRGKITTVNSGTIQFTTGSELDLSKSYAIEHETNRNWTEACLQAIKSIRQYQLVEYFSAFNDLAFYEKDNRDMNSSLKWFNTNIAQDSKQKIAVEKIVNEMAFPFPFVVCGGPGTGKTSVLVEAVTQILHKNPFANILIACQSNSACDEVGIRLRNYLPAEKVFRYFSRAKVASKSSNRDNYFDILRQNSTINYKRMFVAPSKENLLQFKIVIATMSLTSRFINDGVPKDHFKFIFIDECCASIEPECLIPLVGLGMDHKKITANIILIGDDKLLSPIVSSRKAKNLGLGIKSYDWFLFIVKACFIFHRRKFVRTNHATGCI